MNKNIDLYQQIRILGSGTFGTVILAYDHSNDSNVAIKRVNKVTKNISREIEILCEVKGCPYIIDMLDVFYTVNPDNNLVMQNMVFEYIPSSLELFMDSYIKKNEKIPIIQIKKMAKELLIGLDYIHKKNIIHRDLKPDNILLTENHSIKICDFGLAKKFKKGEKSSVCVVNRFYKAPELFLGKMDYDTKIDIFAAGAIIAELFALKHLFRGSNYEVQIFQYFGAFGNPGEEYFKKFDLGEEMLNFFKNLDIKNVESLELTLNYENFYEKNEIKEASYLIKSMMDWEPQKRPTAEECLKFKFFENNNNNNNK